MKDSYTIHEIASLYGVGPDALRYYERLGLVKPRRGENGYRIYDLNTRSRVHPRSALSGLFHGAHRGIPQGPERRQHVAASGRGAAAHPREDARAARRGGRHPRAGAPFAGLRGGGGRRHFPLWNCLRAPACASTPTSPAMRRWTLPSSACTAATRTPSAIWAGRRSAPASPRRTYAPGRSACTARCFSCWTRARRAISPCRGGRYACLYYRGSYRQLGARVAELFRWARKQGLSPTGDVLELYPIDDRFTAREEEFSDAVAGARGAGRAIRSSLGLARASCPRVPGHAIIIKKKHWTEAGYVSTRGVHRPHLHRHVGVPLRGAALYRALRAFELSPLRGGAVFSAP